LPAATSSSRFPARRRGATFCVVPRPLAKTGSSSPELGLLFRVRTASICLAHGCVRRLPWGLVPHRGMSSGDPLTSEVPPSPYVPSSAFRTPSTVFALRCLVGLFHPTTTSGIRLPGVCSRRPAGPSRRRAVPSCRWSSVPVSSCLETPAPMTSPSGPCSGWRSVATDEAVSLADARSPPRVSLLRVHLWTPCRRLHVRSAHDLRRQFLRVTLATGPQRVDRCPA